MIARFLLAIGLAVLMVVSGTTSYVYLSSRQSKAVAAPQKPTDPTPRARQFTLPGTIYLAQSGALYSFSAGRFHQLTPEAGWTQPATRCAPIPSAWSWCMSCCAAPRRAGWCR